jgi:hypothetical protein
MFSPPEKMFWLPLAHPCGCFIDLGVAALESQRLPAFLSAAVDYPCPWHGSASGLPSDAGKDGVAHLASADVWYRVAPEDQISNARRNSEVAKRPL